MHGRTWLALYGFGHKGCIHIMLECRLPNGALEQKNLIGEFDRITVTQIDLELACPFFMDQCVDFQALRFGKMVHVVDQFVEFVNTGNRIPLPSTDCATGAANGWCQRIIRIRIFLDKIKFDFRCHHRLQPQLCVCFHHIAQNIARRKFHPFACLVDNITNNLCGRIIFPRDNA